MEITEIIKQQEEKENKEVIIVRNGRFYQAYNAGAFALGHMRGYKVKKKQMHDGTTYYRAGFPCQVLNSILEQVKKEGGEVVHSEPDGSKVIIKGVDTTESEKLIAIDDPSLMVEPRKVRQKVKAIKSDIEQIIIDYDIANKTPMECMTFLNNLRNYIIDVRNKRNEKATDGGAEGDTAEATLSDSETGTMG
jgi:hypothetical protein